MARRLVLPVSGSSLMTSALSWLAIQHRAQSLWTMVSVG